MTEQEEVDKLAERLLNEPNMDPDDDLRMLSRQLLRRNETIERLKANLNASYDPTGDLIQANRDAILKIYEEGVRLIRKILEPTQNENVSISLGAVDCRSIWKIIQVINSFHPMHAESWSGWPN